MQALTVHQPWAWAIAHADKRVENRTWVPPASVVGKQIAIHAGKRIDKGALFWLRKGLGCRIDEADLTVGAIVAVATIIGYATTRDQLALDQYRWFCGPVGWVLRGVIPLREPVPCRGHQGLWLLPPAAETALRGVGVIP